MAKIKGSHKIVVPTRSLPVDRSTIYSSLVYIDHFEDKIELVGMIAPPSISHFPWHLVK